MADRTPLHFEEYSRSLSKWIGANVLPVANGIAIYFRDVTDQRDKDARLEFQANNDSLTGLANRRTFMTDLELRMLDSDATGVLVADLDGFQQLNETRGHKVGDELLRQAAVRLRRLSSSTMKVYRVSGDEFVFLISDPKPNTHQLLASSINKAFSLPFQHLGSEYHLGMAMGCATYPNDVDSTLDLIGAAEAALLFAKEQPKGSLVAFTPKMREAELRRIELVQAIEASTFEEGLSLYLQPQIDLATHELRSFEALVRWSDKKLGFVSPAEFIPLAEAAGLIPKIDNFIIETVCAQQRRWLDEGTKVVPIAVNATPSSVLDKTFLAKMEEVTTKYGISKDLLAIEMTESAAMLNSESAMDALAEIADAGVEVHLDDFGSGYSNLSRLRHLSVSVIKLDKSLVQDIETDVVGQSIILAITQIAGRLDRLVLAEGIEDVDHLTTLQSLGMHLGQGYLLGRPEPPRILRRLQLLRRWSHEQFTEVLPGSPRTRRTHGARAPSRLSADSRPRTADGQQLVLPGKSHGLFRARHRLDAVRRQSPHTARWHRIRGGCWVVASSQKASVSPRESPRTSAVCLRCSCSFFRLVRGRPSAYETEMARTRPSPWLPTAPACPLLPLTWTQTSCDLPKITLYCVPYDAIMTWPP